MKYLIVKAEDGTPELDTYLSCGYAPFAVVSTPVEVGAEQVRNEYDAVIGTRPIIAGYVNVIWLRLGVQRG